VSTVTEGKHPFAGPYSFSGALWMLCSFILPKMIVPIVFLFILFTEMRNMQSTAREHTQSFSGD
jgi:hypothetical protein